MNIRLPLLVTSISFLLVACGGGGGGSTVASSQTDPAAPATVGLIITDAAIDDWDQALATITSIELLGEDEASTHALFSGEETVDLLRLRDFVEVFAIDEGVPPGTYEKIRLRLSALELVRLDAVTGDVTESRLTDLVANGKIDLNPRGSFDIEPGGVLFITLDFAVNSFKLTEAGNSGRLIVRPVIFVDIDTAGPGFRGLARFQGTIDRLSTDDLGLLLCGERLLAYAGDDSSSTVDRRCVRVVTDMDTGVFAQDGLPTSFPELMEGDAVTVIGRLSRRMDDPDIDPISEPDSNDDNTELRDPIVLHAYTIEAGEPGTWPRVAGTVLTSPVNDLFDLAVAPAQGFSPGSEIATRLFPLTRLFTPRGEELDRTALEPGRDAVVDAVLNLAQGDTGSNELRAALIVIDTEEDPAQEDTLSGDLITIDGTQLTVATDTGDRCVNAADARIVQVSRGDDETGETIVTEEINRGELESLLEGLEPGQRLETEVLGSEGTGGCFDAAVLIVQIREPTAE